MITIKNKLKAAILPILAAGAILSSCNKDVHQFAPITQVPPTIGNRLAAAIAATPTDSLYYKLIVRAGMTATLNDSTKKYTMFITDNNGMKIFVNAASGGAIPLGAPDATFAGFISSTLPVATAAGIVQYNTSGQVLPSSALPTTFPNTPLPTSIILDPTNQFLKMQIFPVKGTPYSYVNNIPVTMFDIYAANGIIHHTYTLVTPPSATLKTMIAAEPTLSYFRAAIARGDSGATGTNRFDSLLNYGVTNMTVLTPNDAALQPVLFGALYQGLYPTVYATIYNTAYNAAITGGATPTAAAATATAAATAAAPGTTNTQATALASTPAGFNYLPVATVRGIMAYHFFATKTSSGYQPNIRVFSVNFPSTPTAIQTLVNTSVAAHPGVLAQATYSGPSVTAIKFTGYGTTPSGGTPYSGPAANAIAFDKHAVNGIYHIIDKVLLPQ